MSKLLRAIWGFVQAYVYAQRNAWLDACYVFHHTLKPPRPISPSELRRAIIQHLEHHRAFITPETIAKSEHDYFAHLALHAGSICPGCGAAAEVICAFSCPVAARLP